MPLVTVTLGGKDPPAIAAFQTITGTSSGSADTARAQTHAATTECARATPHVRVILDTQVQVVTNALMATTALVPPRASLVPAWPRWVQSAMDMELVRTASMAMVNARVILGLQEVLVFPQRSPR